MSWSPAWRRCGKCCGTKAAPPTRLVRWEGDIRMRLSGVDSPQHRQTVLKALQAVMQEAGIRLIDVTDQPAHSANLSVEITPDTALEDVQPCVTVLDFRTEAQIDTARVQMRSKDAWRCAHHEAMHVMGVRGHPSGRTVLSYFPAKVDALEPLDRIMLRAWYSPRMRGGMAPFEAMNVLADALVTAQPDPALALALPVRDQFFSTTVQRMNAYARGQGDVPAAVRRSGKATEEGVRWGRAEMSYFLGVAYLQGATVPADRKQAIQWFERAASTGNPTAQARLGSFR